MKMHHLNLETTEFCLEFLEDSLLEELCWKFVDRVTSYLEEDL
jgi:hypothetical protein